MDDWIDDPKPLLFRRGTLQKGLHKPPRNLQRPSLSKSKNSTTLPRYQGQHPTNRRTQVNLTLRRFYTNPLYISLTLNILATSLNISIIWIMFSMMPTTEALKTDTHQLQVTVSPTFEFSQLGYTYEVNQFYFIATEIDLETIYDLISKLETQLNVTNKEIGTPGSTKKDSTNLQNIKKRLADFYQSAETRRTRRENNVWKKVQPYIPMTTQIAASLLKSLTEGSLSNQLSAILSNKTQLITSKVATGLQNTLTKMTETLPTEPGEQRNASLNDKYPFLTDQIARLRTLSLSYTSAMIQLRNRKFPVTLFDKQYLKTLYQQITDQLYQNEAKPISKSADFLLQCFSTLYKKENSQNLLIISQIPYQKGEKLRIYKYNENPVNIHLQYHVKVTSFSKENILLVNPISKKFRILNKDSISKCKLYGEQYFCPQITSLQTLPDTNCLYDLFLSRQSAAKTCNIEIFESNYYLLQLSVNRYQIYTKTPLLLQTQCTTLNTRSIITSETILELNQTCNMVTSAKFHLSYNRIIKDEYVTITHPSVFSHLQKQVIQYLKNPIIFQILRTLKPEPISLSKLELIDTTKDLIKTFDINTIYALTLSVIALLITSIKPVLYVIKRIRHFHLENPCRRNRQRHTLNLVLTQALNEPSAPPPTPDNEENYTRVRTQDLARQALSYTE